MRLPLPLFTTMSLLAVWSMGCNPQDVSPGDGDSGVPSKVASGGALGSTGGATSGSGGAPVATGTGGALAGTGGATTGGTGTGGRAGGAGGAVQGGSDDGHLFTDASVAMSSGGTTGAVDASVPRADAGTDGPPGNGHTATCSIPTVGLTAVFTQTGTDVKVVITATRCPAGNHVIQIHDGFSCDSAATQGGIWGGTRGTGIGSAASTFTCNSAMQGTLTYTRPGSNAATSWTVGDHNTLTDVTLHPMMLDANCGTFF
jgi:hypothetical protein